MALFFIFSLFLGAALQLTNMYGDAFLSGFKYMDEFKDSFVVRYLPLLCPFLKFLKHFSY